MSDEQQPTQEEKQKKAAKMFNAYNKAWRNLCRLKAAVRRAEVKVSEAKVEYAKSVGEL